MDHHNDNAPDAGARVNNSRETLLAGTSLGTPVAGMRTMWGLISAYWKSDEKKKAWLLTGALAACTVADIAVQAGMTYAIKDFTDACLNKTIFEPKGLMSAAQYALLAYGALPLASSLKDFAGNYLHISWRGFLSRQFTNAKNTNNAGFHVTNLPGSVVHPDQIIHEGSREVAGQVSGLGSGLFNACISLSTFTAVLASISGTQTVEMFNRSLNVPAPTFWIGMGAMIALAGVQTAYYRYFGRPLDLLNLKQTIKEGVYRAKNMLAFNKAGEIAGYGKDAIKAHKVDDALSDLLDNSNNLAKKRFRYNAATRSFQHGFSFNYAALGGILYNTTSMSWGQGTQLASTIHSLQTNLSWFGNVRADWAQAKSWCVRMTELAQHLESAQDPHQFYAQGGNRADIQIHTHNRSSILFRDIVIDNPKTHEPILRVPNLEIAQGEKVILTGRSGTGKSCLLRIPFKQFYYGEGTCHIPADKKMVMADGHILPQQTLRNNLAFPENPDAYTDEDYKEALTQSRLDQFTNDLDDQDRDWSMLSDGEKQRLTCARLMLTKPDIAVLDEGFSAMDPALQVDMCHHLIENLPDTTIIAVVHAGQDKLQPLFTRHIDVQDDHTLQITKIDPQVIPFPKPLPPPELKRVI